MGRAIVLGATRGTGLQLARALVTSNAKPVLVARNVEKARHLFARDATIVAADVMRPETLGSVFAHQTEVLYYTVDVTGGIGGRAFFGSRSTIRGVVFNGLVNVVNAAKAAQWKGQFVMLSTIGLRHKPWLFRSLMNVMKPGMVQASLDKAECLKASGLRYTIVQAGALHDGQDSGQTLCITADEIAMTLKTRIAREHLAQVMLACAAEPAALGQTVSVYGGRAEEVTDHRVRSLLRAALCK